jgi:outer membrane receptor protein involved in Fe transport
MDLPAIDSYDAGSPEHQAQLRSTLDLPGNLEFNGAVYYVDSINVPYGLGQMNLPAYVRLDLGLVWHPTKSLDIGVWGQNLTEDAHAEFTSYKTPLVTEIPRSVMGKITLRF